MCVLRVWTLLSHSHNLARQLIYIEGCLVTQRYLFTLLWEATGNIGNIFVDVTVRRTTKADTASVVWVYAAGNRASTVGSVLNSLLVCTGLYVKRRVKVKIIEHTQVSKPLLTESMKGGHLEAVGGGSMKYGAVFIKFTSVNSTASAKIVSNMF